MKTIGKSLSVAALVILAATAGHLFGDRAANVLMPSAGAAGGTVTGPNIAAPDRYVYYPGTEVLAKDEIRIVACGTGMPDQRRAQASACFLFEMGNGDKFIFDIGSGSMRNIASLMIPYEYLTKVFLSPCTQTTGATSIHCGRGVGQRGVRCPSRSGVPPDKRRTWARPTPSTIS